MSILVDTNTRVICQGITGKSGSFHTDQCLLYGSQFVGGVTPGGGGTTWTGEQSEEDAAGVQHRRRGGEGTGANASMIFVPPAGAADAIMEAADAGIAAHRRHHRGHPGPRHGPGQALPQDQARRAARSARTAPASSRPASARSASCPATSTSRAAGRGLGVISRSRHAHLRGRLPAHRSSAWAQSTCVGIGGDPIIGTTQIDLLELFQDDPDTEAILMIGEIGGTAEEQAAEYVAKHVNEAGGGVHRRPDRPARQAHGPRRRDHQRRQRHRAGQDRRAQEGRHRGGPNAGRSGHRGARRRWRRRRSSQVSVVSRQS